MRSQNYLIALLNAPSILDFSLPIPFQPLKKLLGKERFGDGWLTKCLEWNLDWCVLGFVFDEKGLVRKSLLSERKRPELVKA